VKRLRTIAAARSEGSRAVSNEQFQAILRSRRPFSIAAIGGVGLLAILYLMVFKPTLGLGGVPECPRGFDTVVVCAFDDQRFVPERVTVPANQPFDLSFTNGDEGVQHNVAIYVDDSAQEAVFVGDLIQGTETVTYHVPELLGSYHFRCDVHPQMAGTLETS
jgi:plastocyanin